MVWYLFGTVSPDIEKTEIFQTQFLYTRSYNNQPLLDEVEQNIVICQ